MKIDKQKTSFLRQIKKSCPPVIFILTMLYSQSFEKFYSNNLFNLPSNSYYQDSKIITDPFPSSKKTLVQPIDSLKTPIGLISLPYKKQEQIIQVSWDWSRITIKKSADDYSFLPFTATVDWYLKALQKRNWHKKFIEVMQKKSKDISKRRGQMLEVVGVDMGNLGRASLRVSGNVNINGKMVG